MCVNKLGNDVGKIWINNEEFKSAKGKQIAIFCNRHGDMACMHFTKDYKCERNFYCSAKEFLEKTDARDVLLMRDDKGNTIRVIPSGFHNYGNLFNADDLISAGLFVQEIDYLQRKK